VECTFFVINLTNNHGHYNFLSTFSGTHYVTPRMFAGKIGFHFSSDPCVDQGTGRAASAALSCSALWEGAMKRSSFSTRHGIVILLGVALIAVVMLLLVVFVVLRIDVD
jgi:hypothetical protein